MPAGRYDALVGKLRPDAVEPGEFIHANRRVLGQHGGISGFPVDEGRGLGRAAWDGSSGAFARGLGRTRRDRARPGLRDV